MDENDPLTLITEAVYARMLSSMQGRTEKASSLYPKSGVLEQTLISEKEIKQFCMPLSWFPTAGILFVVPSFKAI